MELANVDPEAIRQATAFLAPLLPYVMKAGSSAAEATAEAAGKKVGGEVAALGRRMWARIRPAAESKPGALARLEELANEIEGSPDEPDPDTVAALRRELGRLLADAPDARAAVLDMWQEAKAAGITAATDGGVSVGVMHGGAVATGDHSVQQSGKYAVSIGRAGRVSVGDRASASGEAEPRPTAS